MNRSALAGIAAVLAAGVISACGSSSPTNSAGTGGNSSGSHSAVSVDVGNMKIPVHTSKPNVAVFTAGLSNQYLKAWAAKLKSSAAQQGISLTVFDPNLNATTQYDQMQNALQSKQYDAWIVIPLDGNLDCKILSKDAPAAGIVVVVANTALCNRATAPFSRQWQPGTLAMVDGENSETYLSGWLNDVASRLTGHHKIGLLMGPPPPVPAAVALDQAVAKCKREHPNLEFVDVLPTNYTAANALAQTQTMLQSHPEIDTILSIYSDDTEGVMAALKSAGKLKKISVIDIGGDTYDVSQIKAGNLLFSVPYAPLGSAEKSLETLLDAFEGKPVSRTVDVFPPEGTVEKPLVIDASSVASFQAQY